MTQSPPPRKRLSSAEWFGIGAILAALLLLFIAPSFFPLPLLLLVIVCCVAPFFPRWGFFLPILSRGTTGRPVVALTFDDGPDPNSTEPLLRLLKKHRIQATFFVTGAMAQRHPQLIHAILAQGHTIGNHTHGHDNLIMLKRLKRLIHEIESAQHVLREFGVVPLAFRPPVGITNPRLAEALRRTDLYIVNFSKRAGDFGNRRIRKLSARILDNLRGDDIIMLHDVSPVTTDRLRYFMEEVERILNGVASRGLTIVPLEELIGRPVMDRVPKTTSGADFPATPEVGQP